jgi:predicted AAA+ superfamily ATPase
MIGRHITDQVREALTDTPAVLVNGARQTGKRTLVQSEELGEQDRRLAGCRERRS